MNDNSSLPEALDSLSLHHHCCLFFEDRREQLAAVLAFLGLGLERREKCIWVVPDGHEPAAAQALREGGVPVEAALKSGALELRSTDSLARAAADPARADKLEFLQAALEAALAAGFAGLRTTVEVGHLRPEGPRTAWLFPHEARLNAFLEQNPCLSLCQYDRRLFPPEELLGAVRTHPFIIHRGCLWRNFYHLPPEEYLLADQPARELDRLLDSIRLRGQMEAALHRTHGELEARVQERTGQLQRANRALQEEIAQHSRAAAALRDSEAALQRSSQQLRALAAGLLTALEEERRRVSRELHDDLNQKLAMLAVQAESLQQDLPLTPDAVRARIDQLRQGVVSLSDDVRHIAYQLHPSVLDHLGLAVALRLYCEDFSHRHGLRVKFVRRRLPEAVAPEVALCLYRVAQEALGNVAKHSQSARATVALSGPPGSLHLSITDYGVGFDRAAVESRRGLGLISMEERVRLVEGRFSVRSRPGYGTRLDVRIPLAPEAS